MSAFLSFTVRQWSAWAADVATPEQWREWAEGALLIGNGEQVPPLSFVPALQRRRFSRLSRLQLQVAYDCAAGNHSVRTIFCSRHGEIHRTHGLLSELARSEPLSPMAFSLSVHNTGSGLYSIASGNTAPSTAIAAGRDSLAMALIEAAGQLQYATEVLVVFADEPLPENYAAFADENTAAFGLALRLAKAGDPGAQLTLRSIAQESACVTAPESAGLSVLRLLVGDDDRIVVAGERSAWEWSFQP